MPHRTLTDGWHVQELYKTYKEATCAFWPSFPEVKATLMNCILADKGWKDCLRALRTMAYFLFAASPRKSELGKFDVILFNSSNKPSFGPAINELSIRLTKAGFRCGILSYRYLEIVKCDGNFRTYDLNARFYIGSSRLQAAHDICAALTGLFRVLIAVAPRGEALSHLMQRFIQVWSEIALGRHRLREARDFLRETEARLVICHIEKIPIAQELVMASQELNLSSVFFLCEHPDIMTQPIISQEVWAWNETIASSIMNFSIAEDPDLLPRIEIIGHPESDYVYEKIADKGEGLGNVERLISGRKVFLFVSEYVSNSTWRRGPITGVCIKWLHEAAKEQADWFFIFKTRPYHHSVNLPELNGRLMPENMLVYREGLELNDFYASGSITAAGALGSLGLFTAAMSGIPAFRFNASGRQMSMPFIDELSVPIRGPEELITNLKGISQHRTALIEKIASFPYRGRSVDRMEFLALRKLKITSQDANAENRVEV